MGLEWDASTRTYHTDDRETWERVVRVLGATPQPRALGVTVTLKGEPPYTCAPVGYVIVDDVDEATHALCGCGEWKMYWPDRAYGENDHSCGVYTYLREDPENETLTLTAQTDDS